MQECPPQARLTLLQENSTTASQNKSREECNVNIKRRNESFLQATGTAKNIEDRSIHTLRYRRHARLPPRAYRNPYSSPLPQPTRTLHGHAKSQKKRVVLRRKSEKVTATNSTEALKKNEIIKKEDTALLTKSASLTTSFPSLKTTFMLCGGGAGAPPASARARFLLLAALAAFAAFSYDNHNASQTTTLSKVSTFNSGRALRAVLELCGTFLS